MPDESCRLAVIPARGGSKRVPGKNIRCLVGKPLLAYTIESALRSGVFSRVVVSTESEKIARIALEYGAEVPFLRPAELADDYTHAPVVTADVLSRLDPGGSAFESVAQLLPNCPLRTALDIRESCEHFVRCGAETQVTVTRYGWFNPWWAMTLDKDSAIKPLFEQSLKVRSQDLPDLFCPTGVISWSSCRSLRERKTFYTDSTVGWEIPWQRAVDIDTEEDWLYAELLLGLEASGRKR